MLPIHARCSLDQAGWEISELEKEKRQWTQMNMYWKNYFLFASKILTFNTRISLKFEYENILIPKFHGQEVQKTLNILNLGWPQ